MKLRNKKTGEIGYLVLNINPNRESYSVLSTENGDTICGNLVLADYDTLAKLNEEWKDYEKQCWYINSTGEVREGVLVADWRDERRIGNYFETREEAEKAVEKLKAWKRLKDKGFKFHGHNALGFGEITFSLDFEDMDDEGEIGQLRHDLDLLFGGEK